MPKTDNSSLRCTDTRTLQKRLRAYQEAYNAIDDIMLERGSITKAQFMKISEDLCTDLYKARGIRLEF